MTKTEMITKMNAWTDKTFDSFEAGFRSYVINNGALKIVLTKLVICAAIWFVAALPTILGSLVFFAITGLAGLLGITTGWVGAIVFLALVWYLIEIQWLLLIAGFSFTVVVVLT